VLRLFPSPFELWLNTSSSSDVGFRVKVQKLLGISPLEAIRVCADRFPTGAPKDADEQLAALGGVRPATRSLDDESPRPRAPA
jgi:hypothetical protein